MRSSATTFAALALIGCAGRAEPPTPYDDIAHVVGAQFATIGGGGALTALVDVTMIARGAIAPTFTYDSGMYVTRHDGVTYLYAVSCRDRNEQPMTCGDETASAEATAVWGGLLHSPYFETSMSQGINWKLRGLDSELLFVRGQSFSAYDVAFRNTANYWINTTTTSAWVLDPVTLDVLAGNDQGVLTSTRELTGEDDETDSLDVITAFDRAGRLRIDLDDRAYWLDLDTAEVTLATQLE